MVNNPRIPPRPTELPPPPRSRDRYRPTAGIAQERAARLDELRRLREKQRELGYYEASAYAVLVDDIDDRIEELSGNTSPGPAV